MPPFKEARHLHGERRGARDDASVADELISGPQGGQPVDAAMGPEAAILEGEQHGEIARVDVIGLGRQPPAALGCREGSEQISVAVDHRRGDLHRALERRRPQCRHRQAHRAIDGQQREKGSGRENQPVPWFATQTHDPSRQAHCLARISSRPEAVRAKRSGRYMSSTVAAGCT